MTYSKKLKNNEVKWPAALEELEEYRTVWKI
jgi:hypothetical protein